MSVPLLTAAVNPKASAMDESSTSDFVVNDDQRHTDAQRTADPETNDDSESDDSKSDQTPSDESQIAPKAEHDNDKQPHSHAGLPIIFPPLRRIWKPFLTLHTSLKASGARRWRRIALPTSFSV